MKDGGPAFPQPNQAHPGNPQPDNGPGMSLRDWFAGQALVGYLADTKHPDNATPSIVAQWCYANADAMLKAREESNESE